jgi:hypothetical protein
MAENDANDGVAKRRRKRSTQREMALRDARIIRQLATGQTIEEVAARENISLRRARERVSAILARRAFQTPAEFVQVQIQRLSEAMLVAYGALGGSNLKAVDRIVTITRELDRYYGLTLNRAPPASLAPQVLAPPALPPPTLALADLADETADFGSVE